MAGPSAPYVSLSAPPVDDEIFEWIDLLEAVEGAAGRFVMVELGAGYGRWLVNGAIAARQRGLDSFLVGVEAEPTHFRWMRDHFTANGLNPDAHRLVRAAVASTDGKALFEVGRARDCYGQQLSKPPRRRLEWILQGGRMRRVTTISLPTLLRELAVVDLVDLDIEGAEADVLTSARDDLRHRVKRVHVGTHSPDQEARLRELFTELGWRPVWDFAGEGVRSTPFGDIEFQNGVQGWVNPASDQRG